MGIGLTWAVGYDFGWAVCGGVFSDPEFETAFADAAEVDVDVSRVGGDEGEGVYCVSCCWGGSGETSKGGSEDVLGIHFEGCLC